MRDLLLTTQTHTHTRTLLLLHMLLDSATVAQEEKREQEEEVCVVDIGNCKREASKLWHRIRGASASSLFCSGSTLFCVDLCELSIVDSNKSLKEVCRVVEEDIIMQHVQADEFVHVGVLSDNTLSCQGKDEKQQMQLRKRYHYRQMGSSCNTCPHVRKLYLWEDADRKQASAVCFDVFARQRSDAKVICKVNVMQVCREKLLPRIWARVEIESQWEGMQIPSSLSLVGGDKRQEVVDAVGEGLGGSKLGVEPWLHGLGEAELGKVDHCEAGCFDAAVADCIVDEAQHERLEMVWCKEVAVVDHVSLEVGAARINADALGKWDVYKHGEDKVVDALDCDWGDFALLADPRGPGIGVA